MHGHPRFEFLMQKKRVVAAMGTSVVAVAAARFQPLLFIVQIMTSWSQSHIRNEVIHAEYVQLVSAIQSCWSWSPFFARNYQLLIQELLTKSVHFDFSLFIRPHITSEFNANWIWNAKTRQSHKHKQTNVWLRDDQKDFFKHTKLPFVWPNSKLECVARTYFDARKVENEQK